MKSKKVKGQSKGPYRIDKDAWNYVDGFGVDFIIDPKHERSVGGMINLRLTWGRIEFLYERLKDAKREGSNV